MHRIIVGIFAAAAVKCEAEGGCATFTREAFMGIIQAVSALAYKQELQACNNSV